MTSVDRCKNALIQAKKNSKNLFFDDRAEFIQANWFDQNWTMNVLKKSKIKAKYDIIISNPPYVKVDQIPDLQEEVRDHDPIIALNGGNEGCDSYRAIFKNVSNLVSENGLIIIETSDYVIETVKEIVLKVGLNIKRIEEDYSCLLYTSPSPRD